MRRQHQMAQLKQTYAAIIQPRATVTR